MGPALALHTLFAVIWVGGMFFAYVCLRPAVGGLDPKARTALWALALHRFFAYVLLAIPVLLGTGLYLIRGMGGMKTAGAHVHLMLGLGIVMMLLALHVYFAPLRRLKLAVAAGQVDEAAKRLGQIRVFVAINLTLGLVVVAVASGGRYLLGS